MYASDAQTAVDSKDDHQSNLTRVTKSTVRPMSSKVGGINYGEEGGLRVVRTANGESTRIR